MFIMLDGLLKEFVSGRRKNSSGSIRMYTVEGKFTVPVKGSIPILFWRKWRVP